MLAAVAMAACAQANLVNSSITAYEKDSSPAVANASWYSCYFMTADAITTAAGGAVASVDAAAYTTWLQSNFADNKAATVSNASFTMPTDNASYNDNRGQYIFSYDDASGLPGGTMYLAVCFFDNQTDSAFKIIDYYDNFYWTDDYGMPNNWIAAPASSGTNVPEPTSGLMLLLGLAGLALKRKAV